MLFVLKAFPSFRIGGEEVDILPGTPRQSELQPRAASTYPKDAVAKEAPNALYSLFRLYFDTTHLISENILG